MKKLALLLLVAPLALAACGGSSSVSVDPVAYVKKSAQTTAALTSEHMALSATISAGSQDMKMTGSGDFANATKQGQMDAAITVGSHKLQMHEIIDGTTVYVQSPLFASHLPSGKTWLKVDLQKYGSKVGIDYSSLMSQSPTDSLKQLEAAGSVKSVGTETIDGVETTHYQVTNLDLSKLSQGATLDKLVHPKYGPIDVWIGNKDGYVYRMSLSASFSASGQSASMSMQVDLSKFGEAVNVTVPPASDVLDMSSLMAGGSTTKSITVPRPRG